MPELKVCNKCGCLHTDISKPVCARCYTPPRPQRNRRRHRPYTREQGQRDSIYRTARWKQVRAIAITRDNKQCQLCSSQHNLIVHHHKEVNTGIDPYDLDNLETLCRSCHAREHAARRARNKKGGG